MVVRISTIILSFLISLTLEMLIFNFNLIVAKLLLWSANGWCQICPYPHSLRCSKAACCFFPWNVHAISKGLLLWKNALLTLESFDTTFWSRLHFLTISFIVCPVIALYRLSVFSLVVVSLVCILQCSMLYYHLNLKLEHAIMNSIPFCFH